MDPITIGILGSAAVSGLAQYMNSEKARKASKSEMDKVQALYEKMQTPEFDQNGIPQPRFDLSTLTPEDFKVLTQYVPQVAQQVKEQAPELIKESGDMKTGRQAQMDALSRLREVGSGEGDPEFAAKMAQASRQSSIDAQSKIDSILQSQARRGMLGSGNQLAAQLQGASSSMDRAAEMGTNAAAESYRNQLQAVRDAATIGGQVRSADVDMQGQNAALINAYNARGAQNALNWNTHQADTLNRASEFNQKNAQDIANKNIDQRNEYARLTQQNNNALQQQAYGNAQSERNALNQLRQNNFTNQLNVNAGRAGAYQGTAAGQLQSAADRNQAIGGLGSAVTSALIYGDSQDRADERFRRQQQGVL